MRAWIGTPQLLLRFTLAGAPVAAQSAVGVRVDTFVVESASLGEARRVLVALPASHAATSRSYPVLLVLDGEWNFERAVTTARTLSGIGHVPELIVVGVPNSPGGYDVRVRDLTPPGLSVSGSSRNEGGERFLDFLERELLPVVTERYRGGGPSILAGHSSGGVIATYAAATRPAFRVIVSIDAPIHLQGDWLSHRLRERAVAADSTPLRYVSLETRFGWPDSAWSALVNAAPASWRLERERLAGESHETMVFLSLYQGLKLAFTDYSIVGAPLPPRGSALGAFDYYIGVGRALGADLPPPAQVLHRLIEDLLIEGQVEAAERALGWLVDGYDAEGERVGFKTMIERTRAALPLAETVASLRATPFPSPVEMAAYLGEWRGHDWMNPEARSDMVVRFRSEGGRVVAESYEANLDGQMHWRAFEYLKVLPDGLEFGRLNGMRPMGMFTWKGRAHEGVLEGTAGFRGIVLPLPDGHMPPPIQFRLVKQ